MLVAFTMQEPLVPGPPSGLATAAFGATVTLATLSLTILLIASRRSHRKDGIFALRSIIKTVYRQTQPRSLAIPDALFFDLLWIIQISAAVVPNIVLFCIGDGIAPVLILGVYRSLGEVSRG